MSTTETNRANVQTLIDGIMSGRLMEVFETYYADDCVLSENGAHDQTRVGKEKNRAYEQYFVDHAEWHGVELLSVIADGDRTAYEMAMDFTFHGDRIRRQQTAVQTWKDGRIVREVFYYAA